MRYVLGIETSCDETAAAIYDADKGLLAHEVYSQIETHEKFGGVVPELASRDHIQKLLPLIQRVFSAAKIEPKEINGVAYTKGPGLIGALMVGATIGRSLAYAWDVPAVGVHHMEAHLMAAMMEPDPPLYPFVALLVSGGHTQLVSVHELGSYQVLGESVDDAVGETFEESLILAFNTLTRMDISQSRAARIVQSIRSHHYDLLRQVFPGTNPSESEHNATPQAQLKPLIIAEEAFANGRSISELNLEKVKVAVVAVSIGNQPHVKPTPSLIVHSGDVLVLYGTPENLERAENIIQSG